MTHLIWNIVGALVGLSIGLFVVSIMVAYFVFLVKELKKAWKE
ncbi:hypothetical protein [Streptococcus sp. NLN76]|nr:hypothetical protein [Streptococcus sp. NLN76]